MYYKTKIIALSIFVILLGIVIYKHFQLTAANKNQAQQLAELKTKQQQLADLKAKQQRLEAQKQKVVTEKEQQTE